MATTFLAQAIGILLIIIGLSLATERKMVMGIFKELFQLGFFLNKLSRHASRFFLV